MEANLFCNTRLAKALKFKGQACMHNELKFFLQRDPALLKNWEMSSCLDISFREINNKRSDELVVFTLISPFSVPQKIMSLAA